MPQINSDAERLWVRAIGDKLLIDGKVRYMLFFESDEPFRGGPPWWPYRLFPTKNGWHVVAYGLGTAEDKKKWYACWKELYPESDYLLGNWNWLRPHSRPEATFILSRSKVVPRQTRYYRDKEIWQDIERASN
jgi:hypothetical protein